MAKPIAVSAGGLAGQPTIQLPIRIEMVRAAIMPSRLNTSGPATSPASTASFGQFGQRDVSAAGSPSSTGSVMATCSGILHLTEHRRGVVPG